MACMLILLWEKRLLGVSLFCTPGERRTYWLDRSILRKDKAAARGFFIFENGMMVLTWR
jgi:hypothetical protein